MIFVVVHSLNVIKRFTLDSFEMLKHTAAENLNRVTENKEVFSDLMLTMKQLPQASPGYDILEQTYFDSFLF